MHRLRVLPDSHSAERHAAIARAVGRMSRSYRPDELAFFFSRRVDALGAARRLAALGLEPERVAIDLPLESAELGWRGSGAVRRTASAE